MYKSTTKSILKGTVVLVLLSIFIVGGCDVEFGGGGDNGGGGGGGGGGSQIETIQGTIVDIIPDEDIEGIIVDIFIDDFLEASGTTNSGGFFDIDGPFAGTPKIEFSNDSSTLLGTTFIDVFPTAKVELGDIRLENATVIFEDGNAEVTFDSTITVNNCTDNTGSIEVKAENDQEETNVIVQITESTDLVQDGDDITCQGLFVGDDVEVQGEQLSGNNVDASRIEIQ